jgi:hypothetical protein
VNFPDRIRIEREPPAAPKEIVHESTACRFSFLEAIKTEQLMGAQTAQASIMLPISTEWITDGLAMPQYRFYLLSPGDVGHLVEKMVPHTSKYARIFQYVILQVFQHGQEPVPIT